MLARGVSFYRLDEVPDSTSSTKSFDNLVEMRRFHQYFNHSSVYDMKRMAGERFGDFEVTPQDIDEWHQLEGKFCSGCVEGKLKEHAMKTSTKLLSATRPGENGVGDLCSSKVDTM